MASIEAEGPDVSGEVPQVPINFVPATEGETFALGQLTIRIMEDGSRTGKSAIAVQIISKTYRNYRSDNRIGTVELTVPANTSGPPPHWHEMHDETFLGTI